MPGTMTPTEPGWGRSCHRLTLPAPQFSGCQQGTEEFSPASVLIHLFLVASPLKPNSAPFAPLAPRKLLSELAKEAGRLVWLREGPQHDASTEGKTQPGNNGDEQGGRTARATAFLPANSLPGRAGYSVGVARMDAAFGRRRDSVTGHHQHLPWCSTLNYGVSTSSLVKK